MKLIFTPKFLCNPAQIKQTVTPLFSEAHLGFGFPLLLIIIYRNLCNKRYPFRTLFFQFRDVSILPYQNFIFNL